jgi:hypothetical protein
MKPSLMPLLSAASFCRLARACCFLSPPSVVTTSDSVKLMKNEVTEGEVRKTGGIDIATTHCPTSPLSHIKLVGASICLVWVKQSLLNLNAQGLHKHVTGEFKKPTTDKDSKWDSDDNVV